MNEGMENLKQIEELEEDKRRMNKIVDKLEQLFARSVDLVTDKSLSNPYFIDSVNQTKTLIYGQ